MQRLMNKDTIFLLQNLGLSLDETELYLYLVSQGKKTVSEIRKEFDWSATKTNTLLTSENLGELLMQHSMDGRNYFLTQPFVQISKKIEKKKDLITKLEDEITNIKKEILKAKNNTPLESKVINYHGLSGLQQVLWNSIEAKDSLRFYIYSPLSKYLDYDFFDDIRKIYMERDIKTLELLNVTTYPNFTNIPGFINCSKSRYLNPKLVKIKHEILIYNNVYAIYRVDKDGIFCTEIYNERLAEMQKQLFDYIWNRSQKMKAISENGEMVLDTK
jgi:sugar-specific transcriptional regulator TrmB